MRTHLAVEFFLVALGFLLALLALAGIAFNIADAPDRALERLWCWITRHETLTAGILGSIGAITAIVSAFIIGRTSEIQRKNAQKEEMKALAYSLSIEIAAIIKHLQNGNNVIESHKILDERMIDKIDSLSITYNSSNYKIGFFPYEIMIQTHAFYIAIKGILIDFKYMKELDTINESIISIALSDAIKDGKKTFQKLRNFHSSKN